MKYKTHILLILLSLVLSACNIYKEIEIHKTKGVDYESFETFAFIPLINDQGQTIYDDDFIKRKTRNYFGHCMNQRNLKLDTLKPDILLKVEWLSEPKQELITAPVNYPAYYNPMYYEEYSPFYFWGKPKGLAHNSDNIQTENIKIDYAYGGAKLTVIATKTGEIVWQGVAQGDLYDPKIMYQDLHPAIHKLMKKFPLSVKNK